MILRLSADSQYLDSIAKSAFLNSKLGDKYQTSFFTEQPQPISSRMLILVCKENNIPFQSVHIREMLSCLKNGGSCTLPNNRKFISQKDICGFSVSLQPKEPFTISLSTGIHEIPNGIIEISENQPFSDDSTKKINKLLFKNTINYGMIGNNPVIRSRKSGDKITFPHRGVSKSLKKLFSEAKIPLDIREQLAVIADDDGVLWVEGFGSDLRALCGEENDKFLSIRVERTITDDK